MISKFFAICGTLFIINLSASFAETSKKEYDIFYDGMEELTNSKGSDLKVDLIVQKIGPTQFNVSGSVEHSMELNDDWTLKLTFFKADQKDGEYRKKVQYPANGNKGICAFLKDEYRKYFYESLKDCSNAPHYDTCPLPPAKYTVTNYLFDAGVFKKFFNTGYFSIIVTIWSDLLHDVHQFMIEFHVEEIAQ